MSRPLSLRFEEVIGITSLVRLTTCSWYPFGVHSPDMSVQVALRVKSHITAVNCAGKSLRFRDSIRKATHLLMFGQIAFFVRRIWTSRLSIDARPLLEGWRVLCISCEKLATMRRSRVRAIRLDEIDL